MRLFTQLSDLAIRRRWASSGLSRVQLVPPAGAPIPGAEDRCERAAPADPELQKSNRLAVGHGAVEVLIPHALTGTPGTRSRGLDPLSPHSAERVLSCLTA